jgi:hypothetical protein
VKATLPNFLVSRGLSISYNARSDAMKKPNTLSLAVGAAFATTALIPAAFAGDGNPFAMQPLTRGYQLAADNTNGQTAGAPETQAPASSSADQQKDAAGNDGQTASGGDKSKDGSCGGKSQDGSCGGDMK